MYVKQNDSYYYIINIIKIHLNFKFNSCLKPSQMELLKLTNKNKNKIL